jgi:O-antigen/teichoic acid export membrane protein
MRLSNRFRRGLQWSAIAAFSTAGLQFLQLLALARLLDKADFGKFAVASLFFQICLQIQDTGINNTVLHRQESDRKQLSALLWANLLLGMVLGILLWLCGSLISYWYNEPVLKGVVRQLALFMPLIGAAALCKVLHQKQLDYRFIGSVEMAASAVGFIVALVLAFKGFGLQALVWGALVRYGTEALGYLMWNSPLRPEFTFRLQDSRFYLRLGMVQTGERLVTMLASQADILLIGKLLGMETLGIYDVIKRLLVRPSSLVSHIVERVALPLYARIQQRRMMLKKTFFIILQRLVTLHFFVYGTLILLANFLLPLFLGNEWAPHTNIFRLMAAFVFLHCLLNPVDSLLVAIGKIDQWLWANLLLLPVLAFSLCVGSHLGLSAAISAQIIVFSLFFVMVYQVILSKQLEWNWEEIFSLLRRSVQPFLPSLTIILLLLPWIQHSKWVWIPVAAIGCVLFIWRSNIWKWGK